MVETRETFSISNALWHAERLQLRALGFFKARGEGADRKSSPRSERKREKGKKRNTTKRKKRKIPPILSLGGRSLEREKKKKNRGSSHRAWQTQGWGKPVGSLAEWWPGTLLLEGQTGPPFQEAEGWLLWLPPLGLKLLPEARTQLMVYLQQEEAITLENMEPSTPLLARNTGTLHQ